MSQLFQEHMQQMFQDTIPQVITEQDTSNNYTRPNVTTVPTICHHCSRPYVTTVTRPHVTTVTRPHVTTIQAHRPQLYKTTCHNYTRPHVTTVKDDISQVTLGWAAAQSSRFCCKCSMVLASSTRTTWAGRGGLWWTLGREGWTVVDTGQGGVDQGWDITAYRLK